MGSRTLGWLDLRSLFAFSIKSLICEADMNRFVGFGEDCGAGCGTGFGAGCLANAMAAIRIRARPVMMRINPPGVPRAPRFGGTRCRKDVSEFQIQITRSYARALAYSISKRLHAFSASGSL